jgi:hypothetical protein
MGRRGTASRAALTFVVLTAAAVMLVGCVRAAPTPTTTAAAPTSSTSATPDAPTIDLVGTAGQNQAYFDAVNQKFIAAGGDLGGRPFIDELVKAGYSKASMEVTPDRTSVNLAADNIQFSIRFVGTCLIGQYGNVGYSSTVTKVLGTGRCLVGTTRPIDW